MDPPECLTVAEADDLYDFVFPVCRICERDDPERPILSFDATENEPLIKLHIFCGKTASILTDRPELEILSKAGIKNKHGTGTYINRALDLTRCACHEKQSYYLVHEFEGNLRSLIGKPIPTKREKLKKIACPCGGSYWHYQAQAHFQTKRHQKFSNELIGK